jgi:Thiamine pyrophosphate enzyme, N-terminal TPP binding domain
MNGAESLVHTLVANGVDVCFANPGTSEMHFVAALDRIPGVRCIPGMQENVVTGMADAYYRIARKPAATLLHCGPGLANGIANLHNAKRAHSGILNIVGDHATYHSQYDPPLAADTAALAGTVSGWVRTVNDEPLWFWFSSISCSKSMFRIGESMRNSLNVTRSRMALAATALSIILYGQAKAFDKDEMKNDSAKLVASLYVLEDKCPNSFVVNGDEVEGTRRASTVMLAQFLNKSQAKELIVKFLEEILTDLNKQGAESWCKNFRKSQMDENPFAAPMFIN